MSQTKQIEHKNVLKSRMIVRLPSKPNLPSEKAQPLPQVLSHKKFKDLAQLSPKGIKIGRRETQDFKNNTSELPLSKRRLKQGRQRSLTRNLRRKDLSLEKKQRYRAPRNKSREIRVSLPKVPIRQRKSSTRISHKTHEIEIELRVEVKDKFKDCSEIEKPYKSKTRGKSKQKKKDRLKLKQERKEGFNIFFDKPPKPQISKNHDSKTKIYFANQKSPPAACETNQKVESDSDFEKEDQDDQIAEEEEMRDNVAPLTKTPTPSKKRSKSSLIAFKTKKIWEHSKITEIEKATRIYYLLANPQTADLFRRLYHNDEKMGLEIQRLSKLAENFLRKRQRR